MKTKESTVTFYITEEQKVRIKAIRERAPWLKIPYFYREAFETVLQRAEDVSQLDVPQELGPRTRPDIVVHAEPQHVGTA